MPDAEAGIAQNRKTVLAMYSQDEYRNILMDIYANIVQHPVQQQINRQRLLDLFFSLETFSLLTWCHYVR